MSKVGALGMNRGLDDALRGVAARIERGGFTAAEARAELDRLVRATPRHTDWVGALAAGVASATFSRLSGVDWAGAFTMVRENTLRVALFIGILGIVVALPTLLPRVHRTR